METESIQHTPVTKMSRDIRKAAVTLGVREARYLVDAYYQMQENRIRSSHQVRTTGQEPHETLQFIAEQAAVMEQQIKGALGMYAKSNYPGRWLMSVTGIGPVIAAGILANIDIERCPTAGHIWSYAGLNPNVDWLGKDKAEKWVATQVKEGAEINRELVYKAAVQFGRRPENLYKMTTTDWKTGEESKLTRKSLEGALARRPWNASLKRLCFLAGESFVKNKGRENCIYGHLYEERKAYEQAKNEKGEYAEYAKQMLERKRIGKDTEAYKAYVQGKLPDGQIHMRCMRWAVKIFLSHFHQVAYKDFFKKDPPAPFAIAILGHAHVIQPQSWNDED